VINALSPSLERLERTILPGLAQKSPEDGGLSAYQLIGPVFADLGPLSNNFNANGGMADLTGGTPPVEPQGFQFLPCTEDFSGTDFLVCESLSEALSTYFGIGTSLLSSLAKRATGTPAAGVFGALAKRETSSSKALSAIESLLSSKYPRIAHALFSPNHGRAR
jgi:hypothetical protein